MLLRPPPWYDKESAHDSLYSLDNQKNMFALCSRTPTVPAERDVDGQLIDFSIVREAFAGEGKKLQPVIIGEHGIRDAHFAALQADKSLG